MKRHFVLVARMLLLVAFATAPLGTTVFAAAEEEGDEGGTFLYQEDETLQDEGIALLPDDDMGDEDDLVFVETDEEPMEQQEDIDSDE